MTTSTLHSRLLVVLMNASASIPDLAKRLGADQQDVFLALCHDHFAKIAGKSGWEFTAAGNLLHMAALRERAGAHLRTKHVRGELPADATPDRAQGKFN